MKAPLLVLLLSLWPLGAAAAPAENHWTVEIAPDQTARFDEAARLIKAEDFGGALPILRRLALDLPANADVYNLLGFALRHTGDLAGGDHAYRRALMLKPNHLGALSYQGQLRLSQGDHAAAEANLARLTSLCGGCSEANDLAAAIAAWRAERAE